MRRRKLKADKSEPTIGDYMLEYEDGSIVLFHSSDEDPQKAYRESRIALEASHRSIF